MRRGAARCDAVCRAASRCGVAGTLRGRRYPRERSGRGWLHYRLFTGSRHRGSDTTEHHLRELPPRVRFATSAAMVAATNEQDAPSRGDVRRASRSSGWSTTCSAIRSTLSFETRSSRDCRRCVRVQCTGRKGCGIYASLAIYVLRHTSSPALAPIAHHPLCLSDLPRDLPRPPALVHVRSFLSPSTLYGSPTARCGATRHERATPPPPHRRTDARPFRSTVSAGSCHHWTGLHTWYVVPINRDPVSSTAGYFLPVRAGSFNRPIDWISKKCLWYSGEYFRFFTDVSAARRVSCRHAIRCDRCFEPDVAVFE
jgi:hypothetical protein